MAITLPPPPSCPNQRYNRFLIRGISRERKNSKREGRISLLFSDSTLVNHAARCILGPPQGSPLIAGGVHSHLSTADHRLRNQRSHYSPLLRKKRFPKSTFYLGFVSGLYLRITLYRRNEG